MAKTSINIKKRLKNIFSKIKTKAIYIPNYSHDKTFFYLTGITKGSFAYSTAIAFPKKTILLVNELEEPEAQQTKLEYHTYKNKEDYRKLLKKLLPKTVGINEKKLSFLNYMQLKKISKPINIFDSIQSTRIIKDDIEINSIKKACQIVTNTINIITQFIEPNITEQSLAARLEYKMKILGSEKPSFSTIVAFGKNSAIPHHQTSSTKLKEGDFILIDFGAVFEKYCSDMTRTFIYKKASLKQVNMYEKVLKCQIDSLKKLRYNADGKKITKEAIEFITKKTQGKMFHGLGHAIGLDVHDVSHRLTDLKKIPENYITSCEPGSYNPKIGGVRIEDDVLITKKSHKVLTAASKELEIIR